MVCALQTSKDSKSNSQRVANLQITYSTLVSMLNTKCLIPNSKIATSFFFKTPEQVVTT